MISEGTCNCRGDRRYIDAEIRRIVRQNAVFGCAACGCPIIEYHHIEPFSKVRNHTVDNIVALCPTCHKRADAGGQWSEELVRTYQMFPYNEDETKDRFVISTPDFVIKVGWYEFHNCSQLIALGDEVVLCCERSEKGIIKVSGRFFDQDGKVVAVVQDNEWRVYVNTIWDVEYLAARMLIVRIGPGNVVLRMEVTDRELTIQQCFFRRGHLKFNVRGNEKYTDVSIEASAPTFFGSRDQRVIFQGPHNGPALKLQ